MKKAYINKKRPSALITGITGQDAHFMAHLLAAQGYEVHGTTRRSELEVHTLNHLPSSVHLHQLSLDDSTAISALMKMLQPNEVFLLAARSSSTLLSDDATQTATINGMSILYFLEAIKNHSSKSRVCIASSSEVFADSCISPQNEDTAFRPINAYGAAKVFAMNCVQAYRRNHGLYACSAILYNHESHLRDSHYVTRKVTSTVARIKLQLEKKLFLGSLDGQRDWMHASDTVRCMALMLQQPVPSDFVVGSGVLHSVGQLCQLAFAHVGLDYLEHVESHTDSTRRQEPVLLVADSRRAQTLLSWKPLIDFKTMICEMVDYDLRQLEK